MNEVTEHNELLKFLANNPTIYEDVLLDESDIPFVLVLGYTPNPFGAFYFKTTNGLFFIPVADCITEDDGTQRPFAYSNDFFPADTNYQLGLRNYQKSLYRDFELCEFLLAPEL